MSKMRIFLLVVSRPVHHTSRSDLPDLGRGVGGRRRPKHRRPRDGPRRGRATQRPGRGRRAVHHPPALRHRPAQAGPAVRVRRPENPRREVGQGTAHPGQPDLGTRLPGRRGAPVQLPGRVPPGGAARPQVSLPVVAVSGHQV